MDEIKALFEKMQQDVAESHFLSDRYWDELAEKINTLVEDCVNY